MIAARSIYIAAMCLAGVAIGVYVRAHPALAQGSIPPYVWLLGLSFIFDLAIMALAMRMTIAPLQMNVRVMGFLTGAALYLLIVYAFASATPGAGGT